MEIKINAFCVCPTKSGLPSELNVRWSCAPGTEFEAHVPNGMLVKRPFHLPLACRPALQNGFLDTVREPSASCSPGIRSCSAAPWTTRHAGGGPAGCNVIIFSSAAIFAAHFEAALLPVLGATAGSALGLASGGPAGCNATIFSSATIRAAHFDDEQLPVNGRGGSLAEVVAPAAG